MIPKINQNEAFLILNFHLQFLINFIDENNLLKHPEVKQKFKNALKGFAEALEFQVNCFVNGTAENPKDKMDNACFHHLHQGLISLEEYFKIMFQVGNLSIEKQESFEEDFDRLINNYGLTRSLGEVTDKL